jgi:ankyrin repeat protein
MDRVSAALEALYRGDAAGGERLLPPDPDVFESAAFGLTARLSAIVERDPADVHRRATDDFTPLHLASFFGHPEAVALLLAAGADPNAEASNAFLSRVRPLHSAAARGHVQCCRLLLEHGAEVNAEQEGGSTALAAARALGSGELVALLLESGAR